MAFDCKQGESLSRSGAGVKRLQHLAYVSLGSNIGDKRKYLKQAREEIARLPGVSLAASSRLYSTEPQDVKEQAWFCNQVIALNCSWAVTAEGLLDSLLYIEKTMGRKRADSSGDANSASYVARGPRIIDLDLLLFDNEERVSDGLELPHPRMQRRAFVLVPLFEIAPNLCLPDGRSVESVLKSLPYALEGEKIAQP